MRKIMQIISYLSLVVLVAAPILFYMQRIDLDMNKLLMTITTITWFVSALFWIGREEVS